MGINGDLCSNRNAITDSVVFLASPICQMINWSFLMNGSVYLKVKTKLISYINLIFGYPQRKKLPFVYYCGTWGANI